MGKDQVNMVDGISNLQVTSRKTLVCSLSWSKKTPPLLNLPWKPIKHVVVLRCVFKKLLQSFLLRAVSGVRFV